MATNLIEYIVKHTSLKQKDLAEKLGVTPPLITRWKNGERIPYEKEQHLKEIANLFTDDVAWADIAKTKENADAWCAYISYMNEIADIPATDLMDEPEMNAPSVLTAIKEAGVPIPQTPPETEDDEQPFNKFIYELLNNYGRYYQWCENNLYGISNDDILDEAYEADYFALGLSFHYIEDKTLLDTGASLDQVNAYVTKTRFEAIDFIKTLCNMMMKAGIHMQTDYYDFVNESPFTLEDNALFGRLGANIESHLSYGENLILQEVRELKELVAQLIGNKATH